MSGKNTTERYCFVCWHALTTVWASSETERDGTHAHTKRESTEQVEDALRVLVCIGVEESES